MTNGMLNVIIRVDNRPAVKGSLEMGTDMVDATSMHETRPNLAWEMVDPAGHFHAWDRDGKTLPTLDSHTRHVDCEGDHVGGTEDLTCYDVRYYACKICGWEVTPERFPDPGPHLIPGRSWWTATVEGLELEYGQTVSVVLSAGDGAARYFGVARVGTTGGIGAVGGEFTAMATLHGAGPLGRKR